MGSTPPQENGGAAEQPNTNGSAPAAPGFSLSFSSASRKRTVGGGLVNVQPKEESRREMVSGFSGGQLELEDPAAPLQGGKRMIPKLENTFQVGVGPKKFNPSRFLPTQEDPGASGDRFELAAPEESTEEVTYGLSKRAKPSERQADGAGPIGEDPLNGLSVTSREWEAARFKQDVESLPEVAGLDAYEAMPVEAFGEAMMRGMGWQEGKSVGKNAKAVVNAKEYVRRPEKLGLGATPAAMLPKPKKYIKQGESREPKKDMIYVDSEGHQKHVKDADAKLVERKKKGVHVGKTMRCIAGTHAGLLCEVLALEPKVGDRSQRATVRLQPSMEAVSVRVKELGEKHESAAEPENGASKRKHKEHKHEKKQHKHEKGRSREGEADEEAAEEDGREAERPWLANHIMVKIIDKKLRSGRLYLKKAEVVDVPEPTRCSLVLAEGGETLTGVSQYTPDIEGIETFLEKLTQQWTNAVFGRALDDMPNKELHDASLETVVPKQEDRRLLVVAGPLRGQRARLLSRNSEAAAVAVQLTADFSVHKLGFDDVSEYAGEFGEEE